MADSGLGNGIFQAFIDWLYSSGDISVPSDYHQRCSKVQEMLDNDISGTINSVLDYAVNSASEAKYRIECSETTLQKLLNLWLEKINLEIKGIPTGLQALSKEYFKERWEGSSFCILRAKNTNILNCFFYDENDLSVDITNSKVYFTIKNKISDDDDQAILKKDIAIHTNPQSGETEILLTSTDTTDLVGNYIYSIKIKLSDGKIYTVAEGNVCFKQEITRREN